MKHAINKKGFTLVELLVVLFIIAILSSIIIISFAKIRMKARDNKRKVDIADIANAVELYYAQNHTLPGTVGSPQDVFNLTSLKDQYLPKPPYDPLITNASSSTGYIYYKSATAGHYCIFTRLETLGTPSAQPQLCKKSDGSSIGYPNGCQGGTCNYYIEK